MKSNTISINHQEVAPDGAEVRLLIKNAVGSQVHCTLKKDSVAQAVIHKTVSEFWHILSGRGELWRRRDGQVEITPLNPGVSVDIPVGTAFQYRSFTDEHDLSFICTTIPPWPGNDESNDVHDGPWTTTMSVISS